MSYTKHNDSKRYYSKRCFQPTQLPVFISFFVKILNPTKAIGISPSEVHLRLCHTL
jgi:hypothetical protein